MGPSASTVTFTWGIFAWEEWGKEGQSIRRRIKKLRIRQRSLKISPWDENKPEPHPPYRGIQ
jgi:hypothetical protein